MSAVRSRVADPSRASRSDFGSRVVLVRHRVISFRIEVRSFVVCVVLAAAVTALAVAALATGSFPISPGEVIASLAGTEGGIVREIVVEWRMPRVVATIVFGMALGVSGAMFQSLTRNPLASPDVIGFSTGSYTGALVVIIVVNGSALAVAGGALLGGIGTAVLVYLLAWRRGVQGFQLIIIGIGVSAMLSSLNTAIILRAKLEAAMSAAMWGAGSLNGITWSQVWIGGFFIVLLLLTAAALSRPMRQLELGDDTAASQGVGVGTARLGLILAGMALTATVTAMCGPIAFIALAAPQIGRRLARTAGITLAPAAFVGALLLGIADYVAQHVAPTPLPVGLITVMIGGGYLGWLLFTEARRQR